LEDADEFVDRLASHGPRALAHLQTLYGERDDFGEVACDIFDVAISAASQRPLALQERDRRREADPRWYLRKDLVGAWCYVDRFAGTLLGLLDHLEYLDELSVSYLHLMPPFARPDGANDGGYAVSDYRSIHPPLGTIDDLRSVAASLHDRGISLAIDFVFNHTADDHPWALAAQAGSRTDLDCFLTFATEAETLEYQPWLRPIFPDEKPGSFIWNATLERWVWSTFHNYQWDLNYRNPEVFRRMLGEMLFLANAGVDILRLDAVPFVWKEAGTTCEGLPQAHTVIRAFNAIVRIATPAMIFKSEAIVHPDEVRSYLGTAGADARESELAYHPLLMVELWEALATSHTHLLRRSMLERFAIPPATGWVNYVRSHDDIGWGFADEDAEALHIDPNPHRNYLNDFYWGRTEQSWSRGVAFQVNPATGDARMCGTTASLAGLEQAMLHNDQKAIDLAVRRIILLHGIAIATPGSPLLNLGDELGNLNDPSYLYDAGLTADSRWLHRPRFDWERSARRHDPATIEGRLHGAISRMLRLRTKISEFCAGTPYRPRDVGNDHLYVVDVGPSIVVAGNFAATPQTFDAGDTPLRDLLSGATTAGPTELEPYGIRWFSSAG
jgi:glycosidase